MAPIVVLTGLGVVAIKYPQLLGNGQDTVALATVGALSVSLLAPLFVLKPLATAACLGSGAPGGLFTPTLTFGVLFGGLVGHAWGGLWPGASPGGYALVGGAAVLAASMQGPLAAIVLVLELAPRSQTLVVPLLLAVAGATVVARVLGAPVGVLGTARRDRRGTRTGTGRTDGARRHAAPRSRPRKMTCPPATDAPRRQLDDCMDVSRGVRARS